MAIILSLTSVVIFSLSLIILGILSFAMYGMVVSLKEELTQFIKDNQNLIEKYEYFDSEFKIKDKKQW